jgi:3-methyladenine DNA glycosylase/8-oxoguanine DNA glycosylase
VKTRVSAAGRAALMRADPTLGRHMEKVGPYTLEIEALTSVYEALARSIVYQQLTGKAAATIYGRLEALGKDPDGAHRLPPAAELLKLDDTVLRGVGLSRAKTAAIKDLALRQHQGLLPTAEEAAGLDDDVLIESLSAVRGIGPWSVQMLLMFRLGRRDVLPSTDYGVQKGYQRVFRKKALPKPKELAAIGERWAPHRSMASWYLWRALDT